MIATLSLSAAGLVAIIGHEAYVYKAYIPVQGDVPTYGIGSTRKDDGTPVKMGDTITKDAAIRLFGRTLRTFKSGLDKCVTGALNQVETDVLIDFAYNFGVSAACNSSIVRNINAGNYLASCKSYSLYRYVGSHDCSTPGDRVCPGVWTRSLERQSRCLAAQ